MNKEQFIKKVAEKFGGAVTIETQSGDYTIEESDNFIGGNEGEYMSDLLGNISYSSLEDIASAMYDYIVNELEEEILHVIG